MIEIREEQEDLYTIFLTIDNTIKKFFCDSSELARLNDVANSTDKEVILESIRGPIENHWQSFSAVLINVSELKSALRKAKLEKLLK